MDAYIQFKTIIYKKLRFFGLIMGHDIFMGNFKIYFNTIVGILINVSLPLLYTWTFYCYTYENELGLKAASALTTGVKVRVPQCTIAELIKTDFFAGCR